MSNKSLLPVTVLSGFLGAGKTTLARRPGLTVQSTAQALAFAAQAQAQNVEPADATSTLPAVTITGKSNQGSMRPGALRDELAKTETIGETTIARAGAINVNEALDKNPGNAVQVECSICNERNVLLNYNKHDSVDADGNGVSDCSSYDRRQGGLGTFVDDAGGFNVRGLLNLVDEKRGGGALGTEGSRFVQASALKGPLLVNFWSRDCGPCITELPQPQAFSKPHPRWTVLRVSTDAPADTREFVQRHAVELSVLRPGANVAALMRGAGNRSAGLPFTAAVRGARLCAGQSGELSMPDLQRITSACTEGARP